ncbi:hypothetical protein ACFRAQ_34785 [Nocardia sp. NPDC056611]|uniref:hypothetical protein n=1 Tax=Nocardia sp. NPDC056611 TaxID=3345877 RepID=UPI00366E1B7C
MFDMAWVDDPMIGNHLLIRRNGRGVGSVRVDEYGVHHSGELFGNPIRPEFLPVAIEALENARVRVERLAAEEAAK